MANSDDVDKNGFLYARSRYYGKFTPEALVFNANLQELSQKSALFPAYTLQENYLQSRLANS